jgi:hypothetical protein
MQPNAVQCQVEPFVVAGADVVAKKFTADHIVATLDAQLRKRLGAKQSATIEPGVAPPAGAFIIRGRFVRIDQGSRWKRYFLTFFAGKAIVEVEAEIWRDGQRLDEIHLEKRQAMGVFGGEDKAMTEACAKAAADAVVARLYKLASTL